MSQEEAKLSNINEENKQNNGFRLKFLIFCQFKRNLKRMKYQILINNLKSASILIVLIQYANGQMQKQLRFQKIKQEYISVVDHTNLMNGFVQIRQEFKSNVPNFQNNKNFQGQRGQPFKLNNRLDVLDEINIWREARVCEIKANKIKIHFYGFVSKFDKLLDFDSKEIAEVGSHSQAYGAYKFYKENPQEYIQRLLKNFKEQQEKFYKDLQNLNLQINEMEGDGNCLFRAISDQIYGTQIFYRQIRRICMDYIEIEKDFFSNYIIGGKENIEVYLAHKRQNGIWGDDLEIQALINFIEIFAYSLKPMRTFHEYAVKTNTPIRLQYQGRSHYNSIRSSTDKSTIIGTNKFGQIETQALNNAQKRIEILAEQKQNPDYKKLLSLDLEQQSILQSRLEFEQLGKRDMEIALQESLKTFQESQENQLEVMERQENEQQIISQTIKDSLSSVMDPDSQIIQNVLQESIQDGPQTQDSNLAIDLVVSTGFTYEEAVQAFSVVGADPNAMVNFITTALR